jgi:hypothetical protein
MPSEIIYAAENKRAILRHTIECDRWGAPCGHQSGGAVPGQCNDPAPVLIHHGREWLCLEAYLAREEENEGV